MRWTLRNQILVPFAAMIVVAIAAVSILSAVLATSRARRQIEAQLQGIAATLSESTFPLTDAVLRQMHGFSGAEFVFVDSTGRSIAASTAILLPKVAESAITADWRQLQLGPSAEIGKQPYFHAVLEMPSRGARPLGRLHVLYPERFWRETRSEAALPPLVAGGVALVATAALARVIAGRLTRPILELRRQVNRISEADYSPMPLPRRDDELRDLAAAVNRLADQLATMDRAIRRSERMVLLGQLAGGLAHHLRNNVTGALLAMQLHARECAGDQESLNVAIRQLSLTEENLKQFLAAPHSAPELAATLERAPCILLAIAREAADLVRPLLRHRRVDLAVVDASVTNVDVHADAGQLRHLVINLVLNAADAAGPGGWVRIETDVAAGADADGDGPATQAVVRVADSGPGPPPGIAKRLFEPFVTSKPEGVGLGLAVARNIAEAHAGAIFFERTARGETCFELHLPCRNAESTDPSSPSHRLEISKLAVNK